MRVIAGTAKGRRLRAAGGTRPTADFVKEALFSSLGPRIPGARVADLWAGSGSLGIEALSRGAASVTFVERDPRALAAIRHNLATTGFAERARVVEGTVERFLASAGGDGFDVVLADPPYADDPQEVLRMLGSTAVVGPEGILALEVASAALPPDAAAAGAPALAVRAVKRYGDSAIVYAERGA
ncbi:MAG: 16S rRNA (guanine(966)-N(2))-methyltransferase RsmD [Actinomycetota bacterium]